MRIGYRRIHLSLAFIALGSVIAFGQSGPAQRQPLSAKQIAQKTLPSVVVVFVKDESGEIQSFGSGFFVRSNIIATNYHVIGDASNVNQLFVRFPGVRFDYRVSKLLAIQMKDDLALLEVNAAGRLVAPLTLGDSSKMAVGEIVYTAGNPEGLTGTFSQGIVSGRRKIGDAWFIQISAPISRGSSGGPVINEFGEVVGIAAAVLQDGQNLNFAVPSSALKARIANSIDNPDPQQRRLNQQLAEWHLAEKDKSKTEEAGASSDDSTLASVAEEYYKEGLTYIKEEKYEEALKSFSVCAALLPGYSNASYFTGYCNLMLDRYQPAIAALKTAIRIAPSDPDAHFMLGLAYLLSKDKAAALQEYVILKGMKATLAQELFNSIYK